MCTSHARAGGVAALLMLPAIASMQTADVAVSARARQLHDRAIVIDTHDDTTQRLLDDKSFDIGARNADGSIDIPRMREGGLDALFFSIWMPGDVTGPAAIKQALQQIDSVREAVRLHPRDLVLATSVADIRRASADRKIAALMGLEGGHMIDEDLGVLRMYAALGVRYMTLTHSLNTTWADSSGDTPAHNGLTAFGKDVVRELNRLGVMVDISHVADKTFFDALEVTRAPVIASHSSARAIANAPRNMTDDMLRALAKNGGVVMINYNAGFISEPFRVAPRPAEFTARVDAIHKRCGTDEACSILDEQRANWDAMRAGVLPMVTWETIVAHIDHAVKIAGVDHVGLGSDFDGAVMPLGMEDASKLPRITDALLKKGYSERDVEKILGRNLLRVMEQVERAAREGSSR
ncbi:MAG: membrane dipeptidase [Acidobacteria bacterium]|nr:MAG: membrane dipeptidase [Acidobacteriota bacterium]